VPPGGGPRTAGRHRGHCRRRPHRAARRRVPFDRRTHSQPRTRGHPEVLPRKRLAPGRASSRRRWPPGAGAL